MVSCMLESIYITKKNSVDNEGKTRLTRNPVIILFRNKSVITYLRSLRDIQPDELKQQSLI